MHCSRFIAFVVAAMGAAAAHSQSFELRPSEGTVLEGNTFVVSPGTGFFEVEVWAILPTQRGMDGWSVAIAYDTTTGVGSSATRNGGPIDITGISRAPQFASWTGGVPTNNSKRAAPNSSSGSNAGFVNPRAFVSWSTIQLPVGQAVALSGAMHVLTATVSYTLAADQVYGDSLTEAGLFLFNQGGVGAPSNGASGNYGQGGPGSAGRYGSGKYQVRAVPEPTTIAALVAGISGLAARRRMSIKKSTPPH